VPVAPGTWEVDGRASMEELRAIGIETSDTAALGETIGARVVDVLGRLPRVGDKVDMGRGAAAEVIAISRRRVTRLRVSVKKEAGGAEPPGAAPPG
ncbi:MAG: transporter associated domain-containing protein, partial [Polyangiaceae bacterium]